MISSGDKLMPPSIGLKMSAAIWGKSVVVFPAAFASSIGSFFPQPENIGVIKAPRQIPTRMTPRRSRLAWRNAFTETSLISFLRTVRQDNSGSRAVASAVLSGLLPAASSRNLSIEDDARYNIHCAAGVQR